MERADGRIGSGTLILVAETYQVQVGLYLYKLNTPNIKVLEIIVATDGSRIPVVGAY